MNKIKKLELVLENCDVIEIPVEKIFSMNFLNVSSNYFLQNTNEIREHRNCEEFFISIRDLDQLTYDSGKSVLKRLKILDITNIAVETETEKLYISVPWPMRSDYVNYYMTIKESRFNWVIKIKKRFSFKYFKIILDRFLFKIKPSLFLYHMIKIKKRFLDFCVKMSLS